MAGQENGHVDRVHRELMSMPLQLRQLKCTSQDVQEVDLIIEDRAFRQC